MAEPLSPRPDAAERRGQFSMPALLLCAVLVCGGGGLIAQYELDDARVNAQELTANPWTIHGVLRIGSQQKPDMLGPLLGEQYIDDDLSLLWAGYLLEWNDRDEYEPELATSVPSQTNGGISADGRTIVYHLRKGVLWQDGMPFTSADVVFSWRAVMNPRNHIGTKIGYDLVRRIDTPDPYTVVVRLKRRFAPFVGTFFSFSQEAVPVLPKHLLSRFGSLDNVAFGRMPIGTGPYRVVSNRGGDIRFEANARYWRGAPGLREIDFNWLPDDRSLVTALREHRIDLYMEGAQAFDPQLQGNRGFTVFLYPFTRFLDIGVNLARPQLRDARVREALAFATDRNRLIDRVTHGVNLPADGDQPPFGWAYSNRVKRYPYNPRFAAQLLDEAGWTRGSDGLRHKGGEALRLEMVGETGSATDNATEIEIEREWRAVGIELVIHNYSSNELYANKNDGGIQQTGRFDLTLENWGYGVDPDDSSAFMCDMAPPAGWNIYGYCNPSLDAAEAQAVEHYDRATRKRAYARIQALLTQDLPIIPLWFTQREDVANVDLQNYKPSHAFSSFWNAWEWTI